MEMKIIKNNMKIIVITSGVLLNSEKIRAIKESGAHLRVSLDGISKETHDYVRGRGSFEVFMEIVNIIKRENFKNTSIHFTLNKINLREIIFPESTIPLNPTFRAFWLYGQTYSLSVVNE